MDKLDEALRRAESAWKAQAASHGADLDAVERKRAVVEALRESGIPDWRWCRFDGPRFQRLSARAGGMVSFCRHWKRSLGSAFLSGPTGVGKTICAVALVRRLVARLAADPPLGEDLARWVRRTRFMKADALVRSTAEHPLGSGSPPELRRALSAGLLVIDDLGNEGDDRDGVLFRLVDGRYVDRGQTIVTTQLTERELRDRYGDALVRRLIDHGSFVLPGGAI
jgi:DNA replication protein DnaC